MHYLTGQANKPYIALANMLTGAAAIGVDSCPIEGFNYDKMNEVLAAEVSLIQMNGAYPWLQHLVIARETLPKIS